MAKRKKAPELTFQQHIADYLIREHKYGVLEQADITDNGAFHRRRHLWAFLRATQADTLQKLEDDYSTDARDEVFKALRKELAHTRFGCCCATVSRCAVWNFVSSIPNRVPPPRRHPTNARRTASPSARISTLAIPTRRLISRFFSTGLPIVDLELKHEKNQNVHDAVGQFAKRDHTKKIFQHPFLYLAADTSDVMASTDPRREENFRCTTWG